jgi:hypothetical protein
MKTLTWSLHSHYRVSSQCFFLGSSLIPDVCPAFNASDFLHSLQVSRLQSRTVVHILYNDPYHLHPSLSSQSISASTSRFHDFGLSGTGNSSLCGKSQSWWQILVFNREFAFQFPPAMGTYSKWHSMSFPKCQNMRSTAHAEQQIWGIQFLCWSQILHAKYSS